jgi:hypothetical protein
MTWISLGETFVSCLRFFCFQWNDFNLHLYWVNSVIQFLVGLNLKISSFFQSIWINYTWVKYYTHSWEFFLMLGSVVFNLTHPKSKQKIQIIRIQSRLGLNE